jgi:hypothetical protein
MIMTLENLLEECEKLDLETLNIFAEILNNRARDKRRGQMAVNCKRAVKEWRYIVKITERKLTYNNGTEIQNEQRRYFKNIARL